MPTATECSKVSKLQKERKTFLKLIYPKEK